MIAGVMITVVAGLESGHGRDERLERRIGILGSFPRRVCHPYIRGGAAHETTKIHDCGLIGHNRSRML